jgi:hypothetical protein
LIQSGFGGMQTPGSVEENSTTKDDFPSQNT